MEIIDVLELFIDWKIIAVVAITIAFRYYFKGAQFKERASAKTFVAAVTGCDCGIGKQIVRELNLRGAKVYMLCRNEEKAQTAQIELVKLGCSPDRLIIVLMDLTKFSTVRDAAKQIIAEESKLDILVNNAAVMMYPKFKLTDDGHELVWQTNYLGHFMLTELLKPLLKAAPAARIVNVSALAHFYSDPIDLETIDRRYGWDSRQSYAKSKLALVMHAHELTKRLRAEEASSVTINACHPGLCYTRLVRYTPLARKPLNVLLAPFAWFILKTPKDGAQTPLYVALSKHVSGVSGQYFSECAQKQSAEVEDWDKKCEQLYEYSLNASGLSDSTLDLKLGSDAE